jgi:hypothetical protein
MVSWLTFDFEAVGRGFTSWSGRSSLLSSLWPDRWEQQGCEDHADHRNRAERAGGDVSRSGPLRWQCPGSQAHLPCVGCYVVMVK